MTLTSESFSISGSFGDNPLVEKMNSFHEQLTENLIKEKDLIKTKGMLFPNSCILFSVTLNWFGKNKSDHDSEDEVFDENTETKPQEFKETNQNLQMNEFARDWARSIRRSPFKNEIFRSLTQLGLVESRRDKLISNFEVC